MPFYLVAHDPSGENRDPRANTDVQVKIYAEDVLPVFTSVESFSWFVRARHSGPDRIRLVPLETDPIGLAITVERLEATAGLRRLIFDPRISYSGRWLYLQDPVPVGAYRRYIAELARGTKRLFAEGRARLGDEFPDPEERDELLSIWVASQADELDADARARAEEWEIEDGS